SCRRRSAREGRTALPAGPRTRCPRALSPRGRRGPRGSPSGAPGPRLRRSCQHPHPRITRGTAPRFPSRSAMAPKHLETTLSVGVPLRLLAAGATEGPGPAPILIGMHGYGQDAESLLPILHVAPPGSLVLSL